MNKITSKDNPEILKIILNVGYFKFINEVPRRGSNFFCNVLFDIDDVATHDEPNLLPYLGLWMSKRVVADHDNGLDDDDITELSRVRAVKRQVTITEYEPV